MGQRTAATRLRIYIGDRDTWHGHGLAQAIVAAARDHGLAGAIILPGVEGYGAQSRIHVLQPFRLSQDLPLVVEIVDRPERIQAFLPVIDPMLTDGLVTTEPVEMVVYRRRDAEPRGRAVPGRGPAQRRGAGPDRDA